MSQAAEPLTVDAGSHVTPAGTGTGVLGWARSNGTAMAHPASPLVVVVMCPTIVPLGTSATGTAVTTVDSGTATAKVLGS